MSILVHISEKIKKDCRKHGISMSDLDGFAERVEKTQRTENFERNNPSPCLIKKQFSKWQYRLVAIEKTVGADTAIIFLRVHVRGDKEYKDHFEGNVNVKRDRILNYLNKEFSRELDDEQLAAIVAERNRDDPPPIIENPSKSEEGFLYASDSGSDEGDTLVCESHEFVADIGNADIKKNLVRIPEMIVQAMDGSADSVSLIKSSQNNRLTLIAYNSPATNQCVLLRLLFNVDKSDVEKAISDWQQKIAQTGSRDEHHLLRFCRVSYPSLICADEDIWVSIHDDADDSGNVANLSLSPEEGSILESCDQRRQDKFKGFPLFINGRAGSGKSTLLQYLFAYSFHRWFTNVYDHEDTNSCPLYLASSKTLLDNASRSANNILSMSANRLIGEHKFSDAETELLSTCFTQTTDLMYSCLSADVQERKFPRNKRIDYATFRGRWEKQFGKEPRARRDYGPQISWHVIRGLIKGFSPTELLAKDDYEELPKDERSVSKESYELVYERVYEKWYLKICSEENRWDNQDLVRSILNDDRLPRSHVAIFCDEAQDFTRVELEAIYRCSLFSARKLGNHHVKRIPFVFAGDPFQTLNPTGFRWASVQAAFTERILGSLYRFDRRQSVPELHYEELNFNYRSAKLIVHFCNSIQACRAVLFDHATLNPQETWRVQDETNAPVFLDETDVKVIEELKKQSDIVLIVPCEEGEEITYVSEDDFLKNIVDHDDQGVPLNVQSAARSKGLEFQRVALYGWSKLEEAGRIAELLKTSKDDRKVDVSVDEQLRLEYFMNNLYVAASRAQRRLFILDGRDSLEKMWWSVNDRENIRTICSHLSDDWNEKVGTMVSGGTESFEHDKESNGRMAAKLKEQGIAKKASFSMQQAAQYFDLDEQPVEAERCRGLAYSYLEQYERSAQCFEKAGDNKEAVDAFWRGRLFNGVVEFVKRHPEFAPLPECATADFLSDSESSSQKCSELLHRLIETANQDQNWTVEFQDSLWRDAIERVLKKSLENLRVNESSAPDAGRIADQVERLAEHGVEIGALISAELFFFAKQYNRVLELLEDDSSSELYRDANALNLMSRVESGHEIGKDEAGLVGDYLFDQKNPNFDLVAKLYAQYGELSRLINCLQAATEDDEIHEKELQTVIRHTVDGARKHRDWRNVISILHKGFAINPSKISKRDGGKNRENDAVLNAINKGKLAWQSIIDLALSEDLSNDADQDKQGVKEVQKYLNRIIGNQDWRNHLTPKAMGAAIERAGKHIDALKFYEDWMNHSSGKEKTCAQIRWVVCKLRQANDQNSNKHRKDAQQIMDKYGWDDEIVNEEYPVLNDHETQLITKPDPVLREAESPAQSLIMLEDCEALRLGNFTFQYFRSRSWVNIQSEDGRQARVNIRDKKISSADVNFEKVGNESYQCDEWNLHVDWLDENIVKLVCAAGELCTPGPEYP